jgi:outer membrane protein insertion porin family
MGMHRFIASWLALFFVLATLAARAAEPLVTAIEIRGNQKIEAAAILSRIKTKVGLPLDPDVVRDDIHAIFGMNYFDQVQVEAEDVPGGVKVIYVVKEKPIVVKIDFQGLDAFDHDEIKDQVEIKQYEVLDVQKLNGTVEKLTAKYEEKGYYLIDIRYDTEIDPKKNEAVVTFKISENDKIQVKQINIIGNKVVSSDDLKKVMQTKEGDAFSWLTGSGSYREAVFDRDIATLGYYYGTLGYVRARFGKPEVSVSPDKKWIYITFSVEEGEQYNVGKVDFSGDLLYSRQDLLDDLKLVSGDTFNTDLLRRETLKYTDKYADLGYAFANVVPQPVIHDDTRTVDVTFEVDKGERVYIGNITVTGNTRTKDKVIRRELKIYEGELYNGTLKRESRENVMRLGFFDSVEFEQSTSKTAPNVVDIEIKVKERSTGQLVIGAGYASGNVGFTAQAQLSQNNFLGNGQVASLSAQVLTGQSFYEFNLGFTDPYVGYSNWSLGGDLYQIQRLLQVLTNVPTYQETRTGFDIKLGHPVLEFTNIYLTYKLESAYVFPGSIIDNTIFHNYGSDGTNVDGMTSSLAANIIYDKRDDRFDPREGWYWSAAAELAGFGGDRRYIKTTGNMKFFHPIVSDFIFRFNLVGSNITGLGRDVPPNELFIQGGLFSERGYDYLTLGPKRQLSTNPGVLSGIAQQNNVFGQEIVYGGHNQLLSQAEIEFPLLKEARIRGVIFFDSGNAFDNWPDPGNPVLYANIGWGFRWFTPIGPLRFEFGYPIVQTGSPKFYFTIGPPF